MAAKQLPHYPHHVREVHRTRRRFWSTLSGLALIVVAGGYFQVGTSSAITGYYAAGTVFKGLSSNQTGYAGVKVRTVNYITGAVADFVTNSVGVWAGNLPQNAQVHIYMLSATPAGYAAPVASLYARLNMTLTPSYLTRSDYPYQYMQGSCYQNTACTNSNYRLYDIPSGYEHGFDFHYVAPTPSVSSFSASPTSVAYGGRTTLSWGSANTASCTITPGGPVGTATTGSWTTGSLTASTTFTATCKSTAGYTASRSVAVAVGAAPTPAPTPVPTATPAPTSGTTATPVPTTTTVTGTSSTPTPTSVKTAAPTSTSSGSTNTSGGGSGGVASTGTGQPAVPDTIPPTSPADFQALVSGSNAVINLSWTAATDNVAVQSYTLERSQDQQTWTPLSNTLVGTTYTDDSLDYDVTYYYRLKASDAAGNSSGYVLANGHTPVFTPNSGTGTPVGFTSDDSKVTAELPASALDGEADCSIETQTQSLDVGKNKLVTGPYALVCKNSSGDAVANLSAPISWTYHLKGMLKDLKKPQVAQLDDGGTSSLVKNYRYDAKTGEMSFQMASFNSTYVLAAKAAPFPWNFVAILLFVLIIIGGVVFMVIRQTQKQNYDEYLTKKYYNI